MSPESPADRAHELLPLDLRSPNTPDDEQFDIELSGLNDNMERAQQQRLSDQFHGDSDGLSPRGAAAAALPNSVPIWQRRTPQVMCVIILITLVVLIVTAALLQTPMSDKDDGVDPYPVLYLPLSAAASDSRSYRFVQLASNSLPTLLVSDPSSDAASAAMSVGTGSSSDPHDRNGLAHFLEHMLFMGSEKFPDENAYAAYLAARGGGSNAFTSEEEVNYFFDIQSSAGNLAGALPLFAGFFTSPLLRADAVERERSAVANEHAKNRLNDEWRAWQMVHELASSNSSLHHFGTGNDATLNHTSIVADLRAFYKQHYRADNMALVLLGRESLDELQTLATKLFSNVPGPQLVVPPQPLVCQNDTAAPSCVRPQAPYVRPATARPLDSPFDPSEVLPFAPFVGEEISRNITFVPINTPSHTLSLFFPLPSTKAPLASQFAQQAAGYIAYILGHEGHPRTLCSTLKSRGLARSVSVGVSVDSKLVDQSLLGVEMVLTEQGNAWQARQLIVDMVFQYIDMMRAAEPGLHERHWATMASEAGARFRWAEKADPRSYASALASRMVEMLPLGLPVEHLLLPPEQVRSYGDGSSIQRALDRLTRNNVLLMWSSSDLQDEAARASIAPASEWKSERWYSVLYHAAPLHESFTSGQPVKDPEVALEWPPASNQFLPASFDVIDVPELVRAAEDEAATLAPGAPTPAADRLRAVVGDYNATRDIPISLPLYQSDGLTPSTNRLYYKADSAGFGLPFAFYSCFLRFAPGFLVDPVEGARRQVQLQLYQLALEELLVAERYQLAQVGASFAWEVHPAKQGIGLSVTAFGSNIVSVWTALLPRLLALTDLSDERLELLRVDLLQGSYESFATSQQPYQHALYFQRLWEERNKLPLSVLQRVLTEEASLARAANLTSFVRSAFAQLSFSSYAYGNLDVATARQMHEATAAFWSGQSLATELTPAQLDEIADLNAQELYKFTPPSGATDQGSHYVYRQGVLNPLETNSAVAFNLQIGPAGGTDDDAALRSSALLLLSAQLLGEAAFNVLRTKWSLGYMVWAQTRESLAATGSFALQNFVFIVQNPRDSPRALEARIEDFLQLFYGQLIEMSEESVSLQRDTLATSLRHSRQSRLSMSANHAHHWRRIFRALEPHSPPQFEREERLEALLHAGTLRKQQLLLFFGDYFLNPAKRRKSAMLLFGAAHDPAPDAPEPAGISQEAASMLRHDRELGDMDGRDAMRNASRWTTWEALSLARV